MTENAVLLTLAPFLELITLIAADANLGGHRKTLNPANDFWNVPLVTNYSNQALALRL